MGGHDRATGANPAGDPRRAGGCRACRDRRTRAARRAALDAPLLRAPPRLARARPRLGDRRSRDVRGGPSTHHLPRSQQTGYNLHGGMHVTTMSAIPVYHELADFIVQKISPEDILAFKVSPAAQRRAARLLDKLKTDTLTPDESAELEQIAQFDLLVGVLKARAKAALEGK